MTEEERSIYLLFTPENTEGMLNNILKGNLRIAGGRF